MKIKKITHGPMTVAVIFLFVFFMQTHLQATQKRRGSTVIVTMNDGSQVEGELLTVKDDALLVYDPDADQGKSIDLRQVDRVKLLKKSKIGVGIALGLALGIGICFHYIEVLGNKGDMQELVYLFYIPPLTGLLGGGIGALTSIPAYFDFAGAQFSVARKDIQRLNQYARESDIDLTNDMVAQARRNFFSRLRFLWLPTLLVPSGDISYGDSHGTFRFIETGSSKDTDIYEFEPSAQKYVQKNNKRRGNSIRFRLEYEWTAHLSTALEYISGAKAGSWYYHYLGFASADFNAKYASSWVYSGFDYSYDSLLLGLNWKPLPPYPSGKDVLELGIAAGPAWVGETIRGSTSELAQTKISTWMAKIHFAYDHYYFDNFSLGGFIEFQYLPTRFSGVKYIDTVRFDPVVNHNLRQLERLTEITIPDHKTQLGGLVYGIRVGLRF
jgi:hypothetical protein